MGSTPSLHLRLRRVEVLGGPARALRDGFRNCVGVLQGVILGSPTQSFPARLFSQPSFSGVSIRSVIIELTKAALPCHAKDP